MFCWNKKKSFAKETRRREWKLSSFFLVGIFETDFFWLPSMHGVQQAAVRPPDVLLASGLAFGCYCCCCCCCIQVNKKYKYSSSSSSSSYLFGSPSCASIVFLFLPSFGESRSLPTRQNLSHFYFSQEARIFFFKYLRSSFRYRQEIGCSTRTRIHLHTSKLDG